jgi:hypothetical protein
MANGRVAPAGFPTGALARSGQGDFHHPALPDQAAHGGCPQMGLAPLPARVPGTCRSKSRLGAWFPPAVRLVHGPPSLHRLRGATALPGFLATMQPSDFPVASAAALVPLAFGLPRGERYSDPAARAFADARRVGDFGSGFSATPAFTRTIRDLPGYWAVRRRRAVVVHPAGCVAPSPCTGDDDCCLQECQTPGHPGSQCFRGRLPHGSTACLPTHQPGCCHPDCKADYRPAGLGFGRAGLAPAGRLTEFAEVTARLPPSGPALPGRNWHATRRRDVRPGLRSDCAAEYCAKWPWRSTRTGRPSSVAAGRSSCRAGLDSMLA